MDAQDIKDESKEEKPGGFKPRGGRNPTAWRILAGLFIVFAGCALLFQKMGYFYAPWLFTWPVFLILLGFFTGIKSGFRHFLSFILIAVGAVFLLQEVYTDIHIERFIWPVVMIAAGLAFIFGRHNHRGCGPWGGPGGPRSRRRMQDRMRDRFGDDWQQKWDEMRRNKAHWHEWKHEWKHDWKRSRYAPGTSTDAGEVLDINAVFGSVKRTVLSKNFAGGEVNAVLGGCEVDLAKADFSGRIILEVNSVFGGTRIILPPTWTVISEMDSVFGSLEDHRPTQLLHPDPEKVLVLQGASVFGGTELSIG